MIRTYKKTNSRRKSRIDWLEDRAFVPEFAGGMLLALSGFFFLAATNTLAGWLYVISGVSFALLSIGAIAPARILRDIEVTRPRIDPVSAGDAIAVELVVKNNAKNSKALLQVQDILPEGLVDVQGREEVIEQLSPQQQYRWVYAVSTKRRGLFHFDLVQLVTASPFGLFRSKRSRSAPQTAIVYPVVLTLDPCPLIDQIGRDNSPRLYSADYTYNSATEGLTKTLRPYRWGDPTRLIHWRTSARFGELRVRELEVTLGGQEVVIALDIAAGWQEADFERAVVAAASLYFYAQRHNLTVMLWTATAGSIDGSRLVLETLASVNITADQELDRLDLPDLPLVWISHRTDTLSALPLGSRWLLWTDDLSQKEPSQSPGLVVEKGEAESDDRYRSLQLQLQSRLRS